MINKTIKDNIIDSPKKPKTFSELFYELKNYSSNIFKKYLEWIDPLFYKDGSDLNLIKSFLESKGLYLEITPEFYTTGINWNWQLWWYKPKEQWEEKDYVNKNRGKYFSNIVSATYMYGDNNEYPTRERAELGAFELAFRLLENNAIEIGQPDEKN